MLRPMLIVHAFSDAFTSALRLAWITARSLNTRPFANNVPRPALTLFSVTVVALAVNGSVRSRNPARQKDGRDPNLGARRCRNWRSLCT